MTDELRRFRIPIVFEIAAPGRMDAAEALHALLTRWQPQPLSAPEQSAPWAWWFPEGDLKHIDGNTHEDRSLYATSAFMDAYEGTPVLELLAEAFPTPPDPAGFRTADGTVDEDAYGAAFDDFTDTALDLAVTVTRLDRLTTQLEQAERVRDGLVDLLEATPLPEEPRKDDYLVTVAPDFEGQIEDARYRWERTQWDADFRQTALEREQQLRRLLEDAGGRSSVLPPRFQNEWLPRDLAAIQALRDLVEQEASGLPPARLLSSQVRTHLQALLYQANLDVTVRDEDGRTLYAGLAAFAADALPFGVYEATTYAGAEPVRLVVGPAGRTGRPASAAFPTGAHDASVLDEIAATMQAVPDPQLRERISGLLERAGRTGRQITQPVTALERGVLLSELLRQRQEALTAGEPEDPATAAPTHAAGRQHLAM